MEKTEKKPAYEKPTAKVIIFESQDIITASQCSAGTNGNTLEWTDPFVVPEETAKNEMKLKFNFLPDPKK